jgi:hypothetical protein
MRECAWVIVCGGRWGVMEHDMTDLSNFETLHDTNCSNYECFLSG